MTGEPLQVPLAEFWPIIETVGEWQQNSWANPFFNSKTPVDVETRDGNVRRLPCPKCATRMLDLVTRWRTVTETKRI